MNMGCFVFGIGVFRFWYRGIAICARTVGGKHAHRYLMISLATSLS